MRMVLEDGRVARRRRQRRPKVTVIGVLGELFITAGVVVLLFLGWQVWLNDMIEGGAQQAEAAELSQSWDKGGASAPAPVNRPDPGTPIVDAAPANAVRFATLIVPRFGADYTRPIAEGVGVYDVLNVGIGHYPGTQMPGEVGNFAIAGHRTGWGAPLSNINTLQVGDSIWIETEAGWYRYEFRSLEYVMPSGIGVLDPVPQVAGEKPLDRIITLTSCNPPLTAAERIIAYGVFDTWYPRAEGVPEEIAGLVQAST